MILHAYEEWGEAAFERLNGQFVVALWDVARETLVLARDRLGVRPLYLCEHGGRLWFASEVKALFAGDRSIAASWIRSASARRSPSGRRCHRRRSSRGSPSWSPGT